MEYETPNTVRTEPVKKIVVISLGNGKISVHVDHGAGAVTGGEMTLEEAIQFRDNLSFEIERSQKGDF